MKTYASVCLTMLLSMFKETALWQPVNMNVSRARCKDNIWALQQWHESAKSYPVLNPDKTLDLFKFALALGDPRRHSAFSMHAVLVGASKHDARAHTHANMHTCMNTNARKHARTHACPRTDLTHNRHNEPNANTHNTPTIQHTKRTTDPLHWTTELNATHQRHTGPNAPKTERTQHTFTTQHTKHPTGPTHKGHNGLNIQQTLRTQHRRIT